MVGGRFLGAALVVTATAALIGPAAAHAANTCGFSGDTVTIHLTDGGLSTVSRSGDAIRFEGANCGAATVLNTETINVDDSGSNADFFEIKLDGGAFPAASEVIAPDIEWEIELDDGSTNELDVEASNAGSHVTAGTAGVNLNADEPFVDVDIKNIAQTGPPEFTQIAYTGGNGSDFLSGGGGAGTGGPFDGATSPAVDFSSLGGAPNVFTGGDGADTFHNGIANDTIDGGAGIDTLDDSNASQDTQIDLSSPAPQNTGSLGTDSFAAIENIIGGLSVDVLTGTSGPNEIFGGNSADVIRGGLGDDVLIASGIPNGHQGDTLAYDGVPGIATGVTVSLSADSVSGGEGTDTIAANTSHFDNVIGSDLADNITGNQFENVITGGGGIDTVTALQGADTLKIRDGGPDQADCGFDPVPDTVEADIQGVDTLTHCLSPAILSFTPAPVVSPPPTPQKKKCKKGRKLKKGKCVKKKKRKH